jgi:very-short-patch-repair endonuclease
MAEPRIPCYHDHGILGRDELNTGTIVIIVVVVMALVVAAMFAAKRAGIVPSEPEAPYAPKPLMTRSEMAFFEKLCDAAARAGAEGVFPQVAMAAIVTTRKGLDQSTRMSARGRFSRKMIDFVLVDDAMRVMLLVELDDPTHDAAKDADRDSITGAAGYRTLRVADGRRTSVVELERLIRSAIGKAQARR